MIRPQLRAGAPTSIGSLPHAEPAAAAALVLDRHPHLPAAPQLVGRHAEEGMLAQAAQGMAGVSVAPDGLLVVDRAAFDPEAPPDTDFGGCHWEGLRGFLHAVADRPYPIKLQLTGPVTLALAFRRAGVPAGPAFSAAAVAVRARARALVAYASEHAPEAGLVVFLDEPGLSAWGSPLLDLDADATIDLLSGCLAALGPDVRTGVHCCGPTDWRLAMLAGPDILSLPVGSGLAADTAGLSSFLDAGNWVAWGAVPTSGPLGESADRHWRRLAEEWCELTRGGCDPVRLRRQALVTPACGLGHHTVDQAEAVLDMTVAIARRVQDQAMASRLSMGA